MSDPRLHVLGVRHHGPGCARALERALDAIDPAEVLVEGPPEADAVLHHAASGSMLPPVALLVYDTDQPARSAFWPFATFSPEWRAIRWALRRGRPVRFVDLPAAHGLAAVPEQAPAVDAPADEDVDADAPDAPPDAATFARHDPIGLLAAVAGLDDGEDWWSRVVEEAAPGPGVFEAVAEAMTELRALADTRPADDARARREALREAAMRRGAADALARTDGDVAFVVGAWHVPAVRRPATPDDKALLRGLPKVDVQATWVPWTDPRLALASGYGAGIRAPGWYRTLWDALEEAPDGLDGRRLAARWQSRVAALLRARGLPASTASVIEATRLASALAALRDRGAPGLQELRDASLAVLCHGEFAPLKLVEDELVVGHGVGEVGEDVPQTPLHADLARQQRALRLPPSASPEEVSLDLRSASGLGRSTLLHRLELLGVPWGQRLDAGRSRGTFREKWKVVWEPELSVRLVEALQWGTTVAGAASARAVHDAGATDALGALAGLVERCLLADLPDAVDLAIGRLQQVAAVTSDLGPLLDAVPPLASILRYGTARALPEAALRSLLAALCGEIGAGLRLACRGLDDDAATALRRRLAAYDAAVALLDDADLAASWPARLAEVEADELAAPALRGFALRRLHDRGAVDDDRVATSLSRALGPTVPIGEAGGWLEGFLDGGAALLLADVGLLGHVDRWLCGLPEDGLVELLPLLRRVFGGFDLAERRRLLGLLRRGPATGAPAPEVAEGTVADRAFARALPGLLAILGVPAPEVDA